MTDDRPPVADLAWTIDRPGFWRWDGAHSPRPATPMFQGILPEVTKAGFLSFTSRYGAAISYLEVAFVNGYAYGTVRIANVPEKDGPPPRAFLLKVITRIDPRWRRLERNARAALTGRIWRDDLADWTTTRRPAACADLRALQAVDLDALDDRSLAAHLEAARQATVAIGTTHFGLVGSYGLPVGELLNHLAANGIAPDDGLMALAGTSTGTTSPRDALAAVAAAIPDGIEVHSLADVREASPAAADVLDDYLDEFGWRVVGGLDFDQPCQIELPDAIVASLRAIRDGVAATDRDDADRTVAALRDRLPTSERDEFDRRLAEAQLVYGSRDDHAGVFLWAAGLTRRAMLACGRRLADTGRMRAADDVFLLSHDEIREALTTTAPPIDTAERARVRAVAAATRPPATIGTPSTPPPDGSLPPTVERVSAGVRVVAMLLERDEHGTGLEGVGIGTTPYRGRARVAVDAADAITRIEPGDVLVTAATNPAFNATFEIIGAIVTAQGGALSHAAIMARELGLPAVIGAEDAMREIHDGDIVEVDPVRGLVAIVAPA